MVILVFIAYFETRHEFTPKPQWKSLLCRMFLVCYGSNWLITNNLLVNTFNMYSLSSLFVVGGYGYMTSCHVGGFGEDGESKQTVVPVSVSSL